MTLPARAENQGKRPVNEALEDVQAFRERGGAARAATTAAILFLGIGLLLGWTNGRNRGWDEAGKWAVRTAASCEATYQKKGFSSVSDCLSGMIALAKEEQRLDQRAEGYDPRR